MGIKTRLVKLEQRQASDSDTPVVILLDRAAQTPDEHDRALRLIEQRKALGLPCLVCDSLDVLL